MTTRSAFVVRADATLAVYQSADDALDYALDHTDLLTDGDVIISSVWTATGDITLVNPVQDGAIVSALIGGTQGSAKNVVTTAAGRRKSVTFCVLPLPVAACA